MNVPLTAYHNSNNVCLDYVGLIGSLFAFRVGDLVQILGSITNLVQIMEIVTKLVHILINHIGDFFLWVSN